MTLDLSRLSSEQRQAVLAGDGPLSIIAGPGSGKTTVLAGRIAYLVLVSHVSPAAVLAITFTRAAAEELRARLAALLGDPAAAIDVTTFHAFGLRVIRQWRSELGFADIPLSVYGASEQHGVLRQALTEAGLDGEREPARDLTLALECYRLSPDKPSPDERIPVLARAYAEILRRRNAIDFADMIALPLKLMRERPAALRLYQTAYRYVLCDEAQDVCGRQAALLSHLAGRHQSLFVVGDPSQTLYRWRGGDSRLLTGLSESFPKAKQLRLTQNFRTTGRILRLANALGAALPDGHPLWTRNPEGTLPVLKPTPDPQAEAAFVVTEAERLLGCGIVRHPGEIAVLFRVNHQATELELALRERHLPYQVRGQSEWFRQPEIAAAIAYVRLAHNPADPTAMRTVLNVPPRHLGQLARERPAAALSLDDLPRRAQPYGPAAVAGAEAMAQLVSELHRRSRSLRPVQVLDLALQASGYQAWLTTRPDASVSLRRLALLRTVLQRAEGDLETWLAELQLGEAALSLPEDGESVLLASIHRAKGGEWPVVFLLGMEEGLLPHYRALSEANAPSVSLEDELRVAYVGVTRARARLYLSHAATRPRGARLEPSAPSRFLHLLPAALLSKVA